MHEDGRTDAEAERGKEDGERRTGVAQLVPSKERYSWSMTTTKLSACAEMSGIPRPIRLHKFYKKSKGWGSVGFTAEENALVHAAVQAVTQVVETPEVGVHSNILVRRA